MAFFEDIDNSSWTNDVQTLNRIYGVYEITDIESQEDVYSYIMNICHVRDIFKEFYSYIDKHHISHKSIIGHSSSICMNVFKTILDKHYYDGLYYTAEAMISEWYPGSHSIGIQLTDKKYIKFFIYFNIKITSINLSIWLNSNRFASIELYNNKKTFSDNKNNISNFLKICENKIDTNLCKFTPKIFGTFKNEIKNTQNIKTYKVFETIGDDNPVFHMEWTDLEYYTKYNILDKPYHVRLCMLTYLVLYKCFTSPFDMHEFDYSYTNIFDFATEYSTSYHPQSILNACVKYNVSFVDLLENCKYNYQFGHDIHRYNK